MRRFTNMLGLSLLLGACDVLELEEMAELEEMDALAEEPEEELAESAAPPGERDLRAAGEDPSELQALCLLCVLGGDQPVCGVDDETYDNKCFAACHHVAVAHSGACTLCEPNTVTACYGGPVGTQDVGLCQAGIRTCNAEGTAHGPCVGEVVPQSEICATSEDEDCDGVVDEGDCGCEPGSELGSCGQSDISPCQFGTLTCNAEGTAYECVGAINPQPELCGNSEDDDCNGAIDEFCGP